MTVVPKPVTGSAPKALPKAAAGHVRLLEELPDGELFQACRKVGGLWKVGAEVMAGLLGTSRSTWFRWVEGPAPAWSPDQRTRALAILRIFEAVGDLHQLDADAHAWVHQPLDGQGFEGSTPLSIMCSGIEGLLQVKDYLNHLHAGWS